MRTILEKKILFTILLFALVAAGIVFAIILPTVRYIKQLDRDTYNLRLTLERKNERVASYRRSLKQMDKIRKDMPNFGLYLFHAGQELTLITTLEELATKNGVVQRVNSSNLDTLSGQKLAMSLTINGPYRNAVNYLSDLEKLPYFITVTNIQMAGAADKNRTNSQQVNLNLDLKLYVSP